MKAELLKRIIQSHRAHDDDGFVNAVRQVIAAERKLGHARAADELEQALRVPSDKPASRAPAVALATVHELQRGRVDDPHILEVRSLTRTLEDIVLAEDTEARVLRFLREYSHRAQLAAHGLAPARKLLFHGPPGNGKTLCAEVLAGELSLPLYYVRFDALIASYLGETAANLRKVFEQAKRRPGVLFFDEVDAIARSRDERDDVGELKRVVNSFLQLLDGDSSAGPVVAATNRQRSLDDALWRRFDDVVLFPLPDRAQLRRYLLRRFNAVKTHSLTVDEAATLCEGMCLSDVARITTDAVKSMVLDGAQALSGQMFEAAVVRHRAARDQR